MFKALIGNLFESEAQTLVNTVNCVGVMGKGVAQEFKSRFPEMFDDYAQRCVAHAVKLGEPYLYVDQSGSRIINFPTKDHWRSPSRLSDIERGLQRLVAHAEEWRITSLAMPPLGCGNGGLEWVEVGPLIYHYLHSQPFDVQLYAPFTTPVGELSNEFLAKSSQLSLLDKGRKLSKLNPNWITLTEALRELGQQPYAPPIGRTIFQKLCYVATEMGIPTGFEFGKGSYGPFSSDVKAALHDFANRNWLIEEKLGPMVALRTAPQYEKDRTKFSEVIEKHQKRVAKIVDLFSRIKNTDQAEEVMTVLYASRQLKQSKPGENITEQQIFDYVLDWKKSWDTTPKREALANAIRSLVLLEWVRVDISESMGEAA